MATRSQIRVVKNGYPLNYYHHFDGYFYGVGKELHEALVKVWNDPDIQDNDARSTLALESVMRLFQDNHDYEPTFYRHEDIEYFYLLDFDKNKFTGWQTGQWEEKPSKDCKWYEQLPSLCEDGRKINLLKKIKKEYDN